MLTDLLLDVSDLNAWYGESQVLRNMSITLRKGETVALLGRNGAGKTTTLKSIIGIMRDRTGKIIFEGRDLHNVPLHRIARLGIGYVPEERGIFASLTVAENLQLPPRFTAPAVTIDEINRLFPNLVERRNSQGTKLSGGEQQMLAIARVLRTGARLLLLDEPTEGLAPVVVQRIGELLMFLKNKGLSILLVEQNFRFAMKYADRFFVVEDGHVIDTLTSEEVHKRHQSLSKVLGL